MVVYKDKHGRAYVEINDDKVYVRYGSDWYILPAMIEVSWHTCKTLSRIYRMAEFNGDVTDLNKERLQ